MKFRFYLIDLSDGEVLGTDDPAEASHCCKIDTMIVIDNQENEVWIDDDSAQIREA